MNTKKRGGFTGSLGFVLAAAGSAVGVGNIWRFPYLAAKDGGGLFLIVYLVLVMTFGFTLLVTDVAIGRRTKCNALHAFGAMHPKWKFLGYVTFIVYGGVEKGIERFARIVMPGLLLMIIGISIFSLTLRFEDGNGVVRTGLQGLSVYVLPNFDGITWKRFLEILLDAMSQLFFSLSVSMGIMITYGSYVKKDVNLGRSLGQIEFFDTFVAFLAGLMIIPAVYVFFGTEGMASGPSLMFISLPKVFAEMGSIGSLIGAVFFVMVLFAALTSSVSIMETLVANCMDIFHTTRKKTSLVIGLLSAAASVVICMGYNVLYFELTLPNGQTAQLLDVMDYISNSFLMPFISLLTCIFIGWVIKPKWICDEMESSGHPFGRKKLYIVMIRYVVPVMMAVLFLQSAGVFTMIQSLFK